MNITDELRSLSNAKVRIVTGRPCSGKTTYVTEHKQPRDIVIDYDAIAHALGSPDTHDHPKSVAVYAHHVRSSLIQRISERKPTTNVWLISTSPSPDETALADEIICLDTDAATCKQRATDTGRPSQWHHLIDAWHPPT